MRCVYYFIFTVAQFLMNSASGQSLDKKTFNLTGRIIGRDTGIVVLYYADPEIKSNKAIATLKNGKFKFTGKVNLVSDAHLWTDTSNHNFSDRSVVRFLLEPANIEIVYNKGNATITGSKLQAEKENFDREKSNLIIPKNKFQNEIDSLYAVYKSQPDSCLKENINRLYAEIYSIDQRIKPIDLAYIRKHKNSYLSGFLLSSYKRVLTIDTLQNYYSLLSDDVKRSSEGKKILEYIYPLTDNIDFRNNNPVYGLEFNKELNEAKSVYDFSSTDTLRKLINLNVFKGQYIFIDFWASWCGPCIENIPMVKKLRDEYKSDSIQFVAVSLDTDYADWKAAIKKHNFSGIQLSDLKGFSGMLPVYCKVLTSIPRYILIDRDGRIINYNAPHPGNPQLKILIDSLLKTKLIDIH